MTYKEIEDNFADLVLNYNELELFEKNFNLIQVKKFGRRAVSPDNVRMIYLLYKIKQLKIQKKKMKVMLIVLLLMIVSCKREEQRVSVLNTPIVIGENINSIVSTQDKGSNVEVLTYTDNPVITYKTKITDYKYFLVNKYENQQVEMYEELNPLPNGNIEIFFSNNSDILLGSFEINPEGYIGNIKLGSGNIDQLLVPIDSINNKFTCMKEKSFGECFTCAHKECDDDWKCYVMCHLAWEECAIGWIIGCVFRPDPTKPPGGTLIFIDTINRNNIVIDSTLIHQIDTIP